MNPAYSFAFEYILPVIGKENGGLGMGVRRGRRRRRPLLVLTTRRVLFGLAIVFCCSVVWGTLGKTADPLGVLRRNLPGGPLSGQVIYIDPGHGGIDPGACGKKHLEKDIVLNVALYLGVRLERSGAKVVYSRTGDYDLTTDEVGDSQARVELIESSGATIVLSIHCNAFTDSRERGAQTFYNPKKNSQSQVLASLIQEALVEDTSTHREVSSKLNHFILNHSEVPAATIELGFLSNPEEEELLGSPSYQQKLAECIRKAVISFVEGPK